VYVEGDFLVLEDLGSLNGTYVNNARIERTLLSDGDIVQIGKHQIQFDGQMMPLPTTPTISAGPLCEEARHPNSRKLRGSILATARTRAQAFR